VPQAAAAVTAIASAAAAANFVRNPLRLFRPVPRLRMAEPPDDEAPTPICVE
jgi:hypothetical protein